MHSRDLWNIRSVLLSPDRISPTAQAPTRLHEIARIHCAGIVSLDCPKDRTMASVGDTKPCPECGKTATFTAIVDPAPKISVRQGLIPPPMTRRLLAWRCEDPTCDDADPPTN
jgi:hypothetical protein